MTIINYNRNSDIFIKSIHVSAFPMKTIRINRIDMQLVCMCWCWSIERANQYVSQVDYVLADGHIQPHIDIRIGNKTSYLPYFLVGNVRPSQNIKIS